MQTQSHHNIAPHSQLRAQRHFSTASALLAAGTLIFASQGALAGAAKWSSTNFQYLYGDTYSAIGVNGEGELIASDVSSSVITLEHVNGWKYGDNFFFIDITNSDRGDPNKPTSYYGEISPRLSLSSLSGLDMSAGIIKDVLFTSTMEIGQGFHNNLYGIAIDLTIPHTPVAQINYYVRNEVGAGKDAGSQVTLVWLTPFTLGSVGFAFEGFLDYAFGMDHAEDNIITAPRLLVDVGKAWGAPGTLQVGIEYQIWRNKYGLKDIDEDVAQAMLKWIF